MRKTAGFDESPSVKYSSCRPSASLIEEGADAILRARSAEKGVLYAATLMVSPGMSSPGVTFGMATTPEMNGLLPANARCREYDSAWTRGVNGPAAHGAERAKLDAPCWRAET